MQGQPHTLTTSLLHPHSQRFLILFCSVVWALLPSLGPQILKPFNPLTPVPQPRTQRLFLKGTLTLVFPGPHSTIVPWYPKASRLTAFCFPAVISQTATASPGHPHSGLQTRSVPAPWFGATFLSLYLSMGTSC